MKIIGRWGVKMKKKEEKIKEEENKEINENEVKEENNIINSNGLKKEIIYTKKINQKKYWYFFYINI